MYIYPSKINDKTRYLRIPDFPEKHNTFKKTPDATKPNP